MPYISIMEMIILITLEFWWRIIVHLVNFINDFNNDKNNKKDEKFAFLINLEDQVSPQSAINYIVEKRKRDLKERK
jgi:hypothetical protein